MMRYLIKPQNRIFVIEYGFLLFAAKYEQKYWQNISKNLSR